MERKNRGKVSGCLRVSGLFIIIFSIIGMSFIVYGQEAQTPALAEESSSSGPGKTAEKAAPGNVSIDFKGADIQNVLRILSLKSGVNIVAGDEVIGKVTIRLTDVPWEKALQIVLRTYGFTYERDDNVIRVTTVESMKMEPLITKIFVLNFCTAEEVNTSIKPMLTKDRGKTSVDVRTNSILVTDLPQNLNTIEMIIKRLDKMTPQVMIEAKMIDTKLDDDEKLGINWTLSLSASGASRKITAPFDYAKGGTRFFPGEFLPTNDPADTNFPGGNRTEFPFDPSGFSFGTLSFTQFQSILEILKTRDDTKILSSPRIATMDNQMAKIIVGTRMPIPIYEQSSESGNWSKTGYEDEEWGIKLEVTPTINEQDYITMKLHPEVSEQLGWTGEAGDLDRRPIIGTKEVTTQVMVKDGETIAIGGLIEEKTIDKIVKIPLLGDIPILGYLFKKKEKALDTRDLLIFITPRIIRAEAIPDKVLTLPAVVPAAPAPETLEQTLVSED